MGAETRLVFKRLKAFKHSSSKLKEISLLSKLLNGLAILDKSLMKRQSKPACPRKLRIPFTFVGGGSFSMTSTFALSTSMPLEDIF